MDYSKSGGAKMGRNQPRHSEHNSYGSDKTPFGSRPTKAELLARLKAAADAKKAPRTDSGSDADSGAD